MKYFNKYSSNTFAGSGNQLYFNMESNEVRTGRILYKISFGGEYNYSILFSNIMDSTYSDGAISHKNLICDSWKIINARVGKCKEIPSDKNLSEMLVADENSEADINITDFKDITFNRNPDKEVMPGEFFSSDPIKLCFEQNEYLCLEITFSGNMIPYHEETLLPVFVKDNNGWKYSKYMPFAGMIGCDRPVNRRIAYLGDSITQGIGTPDNSYLHWNALLSRKLGEENAYWNLGIGFGRANDAASDGAWLYKAKKNDIAYVCYGVNDICQGLPEEQIKDDLSSIVNSLKKAGVKVILQTIPPFNYQGENIDKWKRINQYIKTELKSQVDMLFDTVPFLCENEEKPYNAKYGDHPTPEGCAIWAEELYNATKDYINEF